MLNDMREAKNETEIRAEFLLRMLLKQKETRVVVGEKGKGMLGEKRNCVKGIVWLMPEKCAKRGKRPIDLAFKF